MWKQASVADELFEGMISAQDNIVVAKNNPKKLRTLNALEELNKAAEIFTEAGDYKRANAVTKTMAKLVKKIGAETVPMQEFEGFDFEAPRYPKVPDIDLDPGVGLEEIPQVEEKTDRDTVVRVPKPSAANKKEEAKEALANIQEWISDMFGSESSMIKALKKQFDSISSIEDDPEEQIRQYENFISQANTLGGSGNDAKDGGKGCPCHEKKNKMIEFLKHLGFSDSDLKRVEEKPGKLSEKDIKDVNDVFEGRDGRLQAHGL